MGMKQNKLQNDQLKKAEIFKTANSQYFFFQNFHGLVLDLVQMINAKGIDVA